MRKSSAPSHRKLGLSSVIEGERNTNELLRCLSNVDDTIIINKNGHDDIKPEKSPVMTMTNEKKFNVVWRNKTNKKHKSWLGDGILFYDGNSAILNNADGEFLGRSTNIKKQNLEEGLQTFIGEKEIEIINIVTEEKVTLCKNLGERPVSTSPEQSRKKIKINSDFKPPLASEVISFDKLVMPRPDYVHQRKYNDNNCLVQDVVLDLFLSKKLRQHQREGVMFLYSCVTGIRDIRYNGAILADEMGLGKTIQCISLIWLMLKSCIYGKTNLVRRILIVTPSTLISNWQNEFKKWVGTKLIPYVIDQKKSICTFMNATSSCYPTLIISYETVLRNVANLKECSFQLLVCDEGHRLKNRQSQIYQSLLELNIEKKVILTGTPVQNNLQEFYTLLDFVNPGILGSYTDFRKYYENPIIKSNERVCSEEENLSGFDRAAELNHLVNSFVLRRTQSIVDKYLPPKQECVIFCRPTQLQIDLYETIVSYWYSTYENPKIPHLTVMNLLKKICNNPKMIQCIQNEQFEAEMYEELERVMSCLKDDTNENVTFSGKLLVLENLLLTLKPTKEKIVLISYSTKMLDYLQTMCTKINYTYLRLDGNTKMNDRIDNIRKFNTENQSYRIFLLSAKAGGIGLNLIGASRLVLLDLDWNPASDLQAMSRIWRDGQTRQVFIYRFLTTGSIEEKMYQRQISKLSLKNIVSASSKGENIPKLSLDELKDLFRFNTNCQSLTHELLCNCDGNGIPEDISNMENDSSEMRNHQLGAFSVDTKCKNADMKFNEFKEHYTYPITNRILKELSLENSENFISFIFRNQSF